MNHSVPSYLAPYILVAVVASIATLLYGLQRVLSRAAWPQKERAKAFWSLSAILVGWFVFALETSLANWWGGVRKVPTIQFGLLIPIIVGALLFWTWPLLRRTVSVIPNSWIVGIQAYRAIGVIFLVMYASGRVPGLFALPAGIGDVMVGILALLTAIAYARSSTGGARRVRLWNYLGIADLVIAVTTGFLTAPSPLQLASFDRPNVLVGIYPLALIPVYMVPLSILLHLASLHRLREVEARGAATELEVGSRKLQLS
jgi:small basic protein